MAEKLTALKVKSLKTPGRYIDGRGLYLQVRGPDQRSWLFRYTLQGKPHWLGLGHADDITLAEAREKARDMRRLLLEGLDPLAQKKAEKAARAKAEAEVMTFERAAKWFIATHAEVLKNEKAKQQWSNTLAAYAYPVLGGMDVRAIGTSDILRVLRDPAVVERQEPTLWDRVPETAKRLQNRIERILGACGSAGYRDQTNPAAWRGHLENLLPAVTRTKEAKRKADGKKGKHHPALPWRRAGEFMTALRQKSGVGARALEFAILGAARSGEVRMARWSEIDRAEKIWTITYDGMKAGIEHTVPLTKPMLAILADMWDLRESDDGLVFPSSKADTPLSDMTISKVIKDMNGARAKKGLPLYVDPKQGDRPVVPHGFRSTFADWRRDATPFPRELAEAALAHAVEGKVEAAYVRGSALEPRRRLMASWADFCAKPAAPAGNVSPMVRRARA